MAWALAGSLHPCICSTDTYGYTSGHSGTFFRCGQQSHSFTYPFALDLSLPICSFLRLALTLVRSLRQGHHSQQQPLGQSFMPDSSKWPLGPVHHM